MGLKVYVSGMSGNKEVKKRQQRVLMILDSKNIKYDIIDITEPGKEGEKEIMQTKSTSNGGTVSDPDPRHPLPPQLFNEEEYCGDYDAFDLANEIDTLEQFLKLAPADTTAVSSAQIELKKENGESTEDKVNDQEGENKENEEQKGGDEKGADGEPAVEADTLKEEDEVESEISIENSLDKQDSNKTAEDVGEETLRGREEITKSDGEAVNKNLSPEESKENDESGNIDSSEKLVEDKELVEHKELVEDKKLIEDKELVEVKDSKVKPSDEAQKPNEDLTEPSETGRESGDEVKASSECIDESNDSLESNVGIIESNETNEKESFKKVKTSSEEINKPSEEVRESRAETNAEINEVVSEINVEVNSIEREGESNEDVKQDKDASTKDGSEGSVEEELVRIKKDDIKEELLDGNIKTPGNQKNEAKIEVDGNEDGLSQNIREYDGISNKAENLQIEKKESVTNTGNDDNDDIAEVTQIERNDEEKTAKDLLSTDNNNIEKSEEDNDVE